jgi:hypothetical protein
MTIDWKRRLGELGVYTAAGLFLAVVGPFNATPGQPFWVSVLYWVGLILFGSLTAEATRALVDRYWPGMPLLATLGIVSVSAAVAATGGVLLLDYIFIGRDLTAGYLPRLFGLVWVISAAMTAVGDMAD